MNQPQSVVIASTGCHTGRGGKHTPMGPKPTVSYVQQRECHELTPEEAQEGFIMEVTKHIALHFPCCSARRPNREALFLQARTPSLCNNSAPAPLGGLRVTTPKHWNRTTPQHLQPPHPRARHPGLKGKPSAIRTDRQTLAEGQPHGLFPSTERILLSIPSFKCSPKVQIVRISHDKLRPSEIFGFKNKFSIICCV